MSVQSQRCAFSVVFLFLCSFASSSVAQDNSNPAAQYAVADVVFTGTLHKIEPSATGFTAQFTVEHMIKGKAAKDNALRAELPAYSRCHRLEERHSYLIYAHRVVDRLWIDPCDGAKLISQAEDDLRFLHSVNPEVSERCTRERLDNLAAKSPIVARAEVIGTEDTLGTSTIIFRPWCGIMFTTEDAFYKVLEVIKGKIEDSQIVVEHSICSGTITVDGYEPALSPQLFKEGNQLLLFLQAGSSQKDREIPAPFQSVYRDQDENCGAVAAGEVTARSLVASMRAAPDKYKLKYLHWINEDVDCVEDGSGLKTCREEEWKDIDQP